MAEEYRITMKNIIVFIGPTLSLNEAKKILPNAHYLPPIRCGDILRALRLRPNIIAVIDGYFESTPAVWHKEIIYAIEKGVTVLGASSMGALRASELNDFGMQGIGEIYVHYHTGNINDDDEVALSHLTSPYDFQPVSEPMVNIRATLKLAFKQKIIDQQTFRIILKVAKQLFYQDRTFSHILEQAHELGVKQNQLVNLKQWIKSHGILNLKKQDAIVLLSKIAYEQDSLADPVTLRTQKLNQTAFFRAFQKSIMCRPFSSYQEWLPIHEKVALMARYLGNTYRFLRRVAYLLSACYELAMSQDNNEKIKLSELTSKAFCIPDLLSKTNWEKENDCTIEEKDKFVKRLNIIQNLYAIEKQRQENQTHNEMYYFIALMKLSGDYIFFKKHLNQLPENIDKIEAEIMKVFQVNDPFRFEILHTTAKLWWIVECHVHRVRLQINYLHVKEYSDRFRQKKDLQTELLMSDWLQKNDLDIESYYELMAIFSRLVFLVLQNNLDILGVKFHAEDIWWLKDALYLTGAYSHIKQLSIEPENIKNIQHKRINEQQSLEQYAVSLDFIGGEMEYKSFVTI